VPAVQQTEETAGPADYRAMSTPSFRFRLERVRALREHDEDLAKEALAGALVRRQYGETRLVEARRRVAAAQAAQLDATARPSTASDLVARQAYLERTEVAQHATRHDLDRRERDLVGRRSALTAASRDRQALERLKERRLADHHLEMARLEDQTLGEIAINGFRRRAA
jgi:flagellar FliJ protein